MNIKRTPQRVVVLTPDGRQRIVMFVNVLAKIDKQAKAGKKKTKKTRRRSMSYGGQAKSFLGCYKQGRSIRGPCFYLQFIYHISIQPHVFKATYD